MAFLQRVTNGSGHIICEMALGSGRLDLCVEYRDKRYAVEVKTSKNFAGEKSYAQFAGYLDKLGLAEGWMPIFDTDPLAVAVLSVIPAASFRTLRYALYETRIMCYNSPHESEESILNGWIS